MPDITRRLAQCLTTSTSDGIPLEIRHAAKRSLVNWLGCALGGCRDGAVDIALSALREFAGPPQATLLGRGEPLDVVHAALINAISSNILDYDDTHAHMVVHPTAPVAAALLALAEHQPVTGSAFLHAFILGVEVECRLLDPAAADYRFAWSPTTTVGAFGAAAAAGTLLGLDAPQMTSALSIAATQAGGLRETGGSMSKAFNPGHAARAGLTAAFLARRGFTGAQTGIEGPRGFLQAFGTPKNPESIVDGWGQSFHVALNTYKAFPCGIVAHAAIDGCLQLRAQYDLDPAAVQSILLTVHPLALQLTGRKSPASDLEAKLSVYHAAACAVFCGAVGVKQFQAGWINHPGVQELREKTSALADDNLAKDEARVRVTLRDGRVLEQHVPHAPGSSHRPLSDRDLDAKFRDLAGTALTPAASGRLLDTLWSLDTLADAGAIARLSVPPQ